MQRRNFWSKQVSDAFGQIWLVPAVGATAFSFLWALPLQYRADRVAQSLACVQEKHHRTGTSRVAGPHTGRCSAWLAALSRGGAGSMVGSESSLPPAASQAPACWFILTGACSRGLATAPQCCVPWAKDGVDRDAGLFLAACRRVP